MNKIIVMGRLTGDPTVRYTQNNKTVTSFTLAVDRPFSGPDGKREADFIPVVMWGKQAEVVGNSVGKGHRLLVEGRLQIRNFDGKDGTKHWVTEIVASSFDFVERRAEVKPAPADVPELPAGVDEALAGAGVIGEEVDF